MYVQALRAKNILDTVDEEHGGSCTVAEIYFNSFLLKMVKYWYGNRNRSMTRIKIIETVTSYNRQDPIEQ